VRSSWTRLALAALLVLAAAAGCLDAKAGAEGARKLEAAK
jgi:hypothetical protein